MWPELPFFILGLGSLLGAFLSLLLPETADVDLPDTLEEAEQFGRGQKFFHFPFMKKRE